MNDQCDPPICLREGQYNAKDLQVLKNKPIWRTIDVYESQLRELFEINNPTLLRQPTYEVELQKFLQNHLGKDPATKGNWVYFPWSGMMTHMIDEKSYGCLRTNRNKLLITDAEQEQLHSYEVGVTGLSVGNSIAVSLAYTGVGNLRLAEFDTLETPNLNRLRSGVHQLGKSKLAITQEQIYEINPYSTMQVWPKGLDQTNLDEFLVGKNALNVVFDEIDDFEMKIRLRIAAKRARIPVIMMTSLGDNILIDIERYDTDPGLEIFNGLIGTLPKDILKTEIGEPEKLKYAMQIVGVDHIPTRALESLGQINKTLVGRPQLYSTIAADGGLAAYLVKRLSLGWPLPSGRTYISFDQLLGVPTESPGEREKVLQALMERSG